MSSYFPQSPAVRKAFDAESIERLVRTFYERVQNDDMIGPVFDARIESWEPHLQRMMAFWTTVLRGEAAYTPGPKGPPPQVHRGIAELRRTHFERWLTLFAATAKEVFEEDAADFVIGRSERMGRALSAHLHAPPNSPSMASS